MTLLPPRRCRFLMDEATREVVSVGWADTRMAATLAVWRSGAVGVEGEGVPSVDPSVFTMSFTSDSACSRRRRVMLVLASAPTPERIPEVVLHRIDVEEVAAAGPVRDGRHAGGVPPPGAPQGGATARGEPPPTSPPPSPSPPPLLSPPPLCATPVLRGLAADALGGLSTPLPMALDDELPLPSPLSTPLSSIAAGLSASNTSLSTLAADLGLPPPSSSGERRADSTASGCGSSGGAASVATLPVGTSRHDGAAARCGVPPPSPARLTPGIRPDPSSGGSNPCAPFRPRVHAYDFSGFATTLLDLVGAASAPLDPDASYPEPRPPVHDYAAAMALAAPPGATVVPTHYGGVCIIRGLGVPGGISALSHVLSVIRVARPDVRDTLKVGLVQAMLDDAAGTIFRPLGRAVGGGGGGGGLYGPGEDGFGVVGGWTPRPSLGCLPLGMAAAVTPAAASSMFFAPPWGGGHAPWLPPPARAAPPPSGCGSCGAPLPVVGAAPTERATPKAGVAGGGVSRRRVAAATAAGVAAAKRGRGGGGGVAGGGGTTKTAAGALDPSSAAYRRQVRNRESAARSNEKRRLRRLAAKAEAAATAAAAAAAAGRAEPRAAQLPPAAAGAPPTGGRGDRSGQRAVRPPDTGHGPASPAARAAQLPPAIDAIATPAVAASRPHPAGADGTSPTDGRPPV